MLWLTEATGSPRRLASKPDVNKLSLDLFWLRDESLEGADKLPPPGEIAASIVEDLQNALEQFMAIAEDLGGKLSETQGSFL